MGYVLTVGLSTANRIYLWPCATAQCATDPTVGEARFASHCSELMADTARGQRLTLGCDTAAPLFSSVVA